MYNVSDDYISVMRSNNRPYNEVYGMVTFTDNTTLNITPSIIPENSLTITKQCIDGEELEFGGVYLGTLEMSLMTELSRYAFYGATVDLYFRVRVNNSFEVVPLGKYVISEADRPDKNTVKFTAYDNMRLLDVPMGGNVLQGTAYTMLRQIAGITGYEISFTQEDISELINSSVQMQLDKESGITTYREAVKCICQLMGVFAQDDRTGKMEVRKFSNEVTTTLTTSHWYTAITADYLCNYIALSVTGLKGTFGATSEDENEFGNTMVIEDAPAWDYGTYAVLQAQTNSLFNYLHSIAYTPCTLDMPSDPCFDCGDRIKLETSLGDIETLITSYEWKWHGGMTIESKGVNPYISGSTTADAKTTRLLTRSITDNKVYFWSFTNSDEVVLSNGGADKVVGWLRFTSSSDTYAQFVATILVDITDVVEDYCRVSVKYSLDGEIFEYEALDDLTEGRHIISVNYPITGLQQGTQHRWNIIMSAEGGTVTLPEETMKATIFGQGLQNIDRFFGLLELEDVITPYQLGIPVVSLTEPTVAFSFSRPITIGTLADTIQAYKVGVPIVSMSDSMSLTATAVQYTRVTEDSTDDDEISRITEDGGTRLTEV